ncbi:MAG: pyridoxal phosphate-dependent aminotransferase, partial [Polyangiales bacterium]
LLAAVQPHTRLLFLGHPNNPTGTYLPKAALETLWAQLPEHVLVVVDEAYAEYATATDFVSALALRQRRESWLVLRTFSKVYGLAGARVGYALGPEPVIAALHKVRPPFQLGTLAAAAAAAALAAQDHVQMSATRSAAERSRLQAALTDMGLACTPSEANFILVQTPLPSAALFQALLQHRLIVRPLGPPLAQAVRITVGTPAQNDALLAALARVLAASQTVLHQETTDAPSATCGSDSRAHCAAKQRT